MLGEFQKSVRRLWKVLFGPPKWLMYGLDSGSEKMPPGATATICTNPQRRHIPLRLHVSSAIGEDFAMVDMRVGVEPVLATVSNMSMCAFVGDRVPDLRRVVAEVGMDVAIVVTNISDKPRRFTALVVGEELSEVELLKTRRGKFLWRRDPGFD